MYNVANPRKFPCVKIIQASATRPPAYVGLGTAIGRLYPRAVIEFWAEKLDANTAYQTLTDKLYHLIRMFFGKLYASNLLATLNGWGIAHFIEDMVIVREGEGNNIIGMAGIVIEGESDNINLAYT